MFKAMMLSEILAQLLCWRLIEMQADHLQQESEPFWMFELPEAEPGRKGPSILGFRGWTGRAFSLSRGAGWSSRDLR